MQNKFVKVSLCVLMVVFLLHQLYSALYIPLDTEKAEYIKYTEGIDTTGIIIRSEFGVKRSDSGVMHFIINDGERVAKNGVIADIYTSESDSIAVNKINDITKQLENINTIQSYNDLAAVDIELLNSKIGESVSDMLFSAKSGNYSSVHTMKNDLLTMLNRKTMVTGGNYDFSAQTTALQSELDRLNASLNNPVSNICAEESGFFVSTVDGYETVLTTDDLSIYTPEFLDTVKEAEKEESVGKIVSDYTWYIAVTVDESQSQKYKIGDAVRLHTNLKNNPDLSVRVAAVNKDETNSRAVIVFSCKEMNTELATIRKISLTVVEGVFEGLKVKKSALRVVDGERGVFVVSGMELKFVKVSVLYSKDEADYVICEKSPDIDKTVLRLYDQVVIKGKNLYDGKIIN